MTQKTGSPRTEGLSLPLNPHPAMGQGQLSNLALLGIIMASLAQGSWDRGRLGRVVPGTGCPCDPV